MLMSVVSTLRAFNPFFHKEKNSNTGESYNIIDWYFPDSQSHQEQGMSEKLS